MASDNTPKSVPPKHRTCRLLLGLLGAVAILILLLALLPTILSTSPVRRLIMARVNESMEGRAEVGQWSWGWTRGVHIRNLRLQDRLGLARVTVKAIQLRPGLRSLLSGRIALHQIVIDQPQVILSRTTARPDQTPGPAGPVLQSRGSAPVLPISQLDAEIRDGRVELVDGEKGKTTLSKINSQVNFDAAQGRAGLSLALDLEGQAGQGSVQAEVALDQVQWDQWRFKDTNGTVNVDVNNLDLGVLETLCKLGGLDVDLEGLARAQIRSQIRQGQVEKVTGKVSLRHAGVTGGGFSGDRVTSQQVDLRLQAGQQGRDMYIDSLSLTCDWLKTDVQGTFPTGPNPLTLSTLRDSDFALKGDFDVDVAQLASQLPHLLSLKENTQLTQGRAAGRFDLTPSQITAEFHLEGLAGQVDRTQVRLSEPIQGSVKLLPQAKGAYDIEDLKVTASFARIRARGNAQRIEFSQWLNLETMQAELGQFLDIGAYTLKGQMSGESVAHLGDHDLSVSGTSVLKNLDVTVPDGNTLSEKQVLLTYDTAYDWDQDRLRVAGLRAKGDWGEMGLHDTRIGLTQDQVQARVSVKALQLQRVLLYVRLFSALPPDLQVSGLAQADCGVEMVDGKIQISTDNARIEQFALKLPDKQPFQQSSISVALQARVNPAAKAIDVETFQLVSPQIKITKARFQRQVQADTATVRATAECEYDLEAVGALIAPLVPAGLDMAGHRTGTVSFSSTYPSAQVQEFWRSAQGRARLGFERATYQGLKFSPTDVNAVFNRGVLEIEPFQTEVNQGQLSLACQTDFRRTPVQVVMSEPRQIARNIHLTAETTQTLFRYVNPIFANLSDVEGRASFFCDKLILPLDPNARDRIELAGTLSMDDIYLQGSALLNQIMAGLDMKRVRKQTLRMHPTKLTLRQGVLRYDDMQIDVGDNPVNFSGAIGLDETLDMRVITPYTTQGRTVHVGDPDQSQRVSVALTGTLDRPVIDMDSVLDQLLQIGIQRGLEALFKR